MDIVITIVIGILGAVFLAAAIGLTLLVVRYRCKKKDLISQQHRENRPEAQLIVESSEGTGVQSPIHVELGAVQISSPKLKQLLDNEEWLEDVYGIIPHCLSILKICHHLTDRLIRIGCSFYRRSPERLVQMVTVAKQISPKVDEVIETIQPPLNPKLVESRFSSLVVSVSQLAMITKSICCMSGKVDWIDENLQDIEDHMKILREARAVTDERDQGMSSNNTVHIGSPESQSFGPNSPVEKSDVSQL